MARFVPLYHHSRARGTDHARTADRTTHVKSTIRRVVAMNYPGVARDSHQTIGEHYGKKSDEPTCARAGVQSEDRCFNKPWIERVCILTCMSERACGKMSAERTCTDYVQNKPLAIPENVPRGLSEHVMNWVVLNQSNFLRTPT
jgi:hypothetical protein